jgi:two-component system nitrogen regulation sensor histidine kinase GlnL
LTPPAAAGRPGFRELFGALPLAVLAVDPEGRVAHVNGAAEQLLNLSERLMLGRPLADMIQLPDGEERARDGGDVAVFDAEMEFAHGARLRIDFAEAHVAHHPGWRVVTLRDAGNRGLARSAGAARSATGAAAMLAHEIKNPLSGIRGAAQLLGPGELPSLIVAEVDRIAALIDRMQDFTDTRPLSPAAENIYPLLAHARGLALAGFARGVPVDERYDPSLPAAWIDRDALIQVLINLLKNAREAVAAVREPRITVATAYRHGPAARVPGARAAVPLPIEVAVIDNGPGAPADIAANLFDPFVSGRPEGSGLGLALVDKLVRDMGGLVQYAREGMPPHTVFRLLLPRATA